VFEDSTCCTATSETKKHFQLYLLEGEGKFERYLMFAVADSTFCTARQRTLKDPENTWFSGSVESNFTRLPIPILEFCEVLNCSYHLACV